MPDDRLEREINEILDNIERFPGPESRRARARKRAMRQVVNAIADAQRKFARRLARASMGQVMLAAFLMILGSFFFRRFNPLLMQWVLVAGIVLFISSFAIMVFAGGIRGGNQYWRGRQISHRSPPLGQRLRRWFTSRRRNRS
jgi:hypothetical protein